MFKNLGNIVQQAKQMKKNMEQAEKELNATYVTGSSTANMVNVVMNCKGDFQSVTIDPAALQNKDVLEKLLLTALRDARVKANEKSTAVMKDATGDIDIPPGIMPF